MPEACCTADCVLNNKLLYSRLPVDILFPITIVLRIVEHCRCFLQYPSPHTQHPINFRGEIKVFPKPAIIHITTPLGVKGEGRGELYLRISNILVTSLWAWVEDKINSLQWTGSRPLPKNLLQTETRTEQCKPFWPSCRWQPGTAPRPSSWERQGCCRLSRAAGGWGSRAAAPPSFAPSWTAWPA